MPELLPRGSTSIREPSHSSMYVAASSRTTGAKAVDPVTRSSPRAQSSGGGVSSRTRMIAARTTTQTVRDTVMSRAARPNSGGLSSGRAARLTVTSPSRMPPVIRIGLPTSAPVSSTSSLKCSPRFSGTRGSRISDPLCRIPAAGVKCSIRCTAPGAG